MTSRSGYGVRVCAERPEVDAGHFTLRAPWGLEALRDADTIIVPGTADPSRPLPDAVHAALTAAAADGTRLSVMALEREGGQAQFIVQQHPPAPRGATLEPTLLWMQENLSRELSLTDIR